MNTSWLKELNLKPRSGSVKTFKSYVNFNDNGSTKPSTADEGAKNTFSEKHETEEPVPYPPPSLLPGELIITEAENVLKFNALSTLNKGIPGILICTNFRLSFLTAENFPSNMYQRNLLLAENDICLINIDVIYHVTGGKRKKISLSNFPTSFEILEVHCKDFRIYTFSFKFSPVNHKAVISAILHHALASRIHLLFAFDYIEPTASTSERDTDSIRFTKPSDWESELQRCQCPGWRVTHANEKFLLCDSLPECFVVPATLLDMNLNKASPNFIGHRTPTWSWGLSSGASIIRMAAMDPGISDNRQLEFIVDAIGRTTPYNINVKVFNGDELCPSFKEIQSSFLKLKELCMPTTAQEFWESDSGYLSKLDSTKWLHHVSSCLSVALDAALVLQGNTSVVLIENSGRDTSCILSSLIQIFLDSSYHSQRGFETLIQKEWVALGHPFTSRHHLTSSSEGEESPVFLLFLDCVWQLMQQCPTVFEFSETYLTSVWDSCHISIFDTFLFDSHKNRYEATFGHGPKNKFRLRSVWNWSKQFSRNDIKLFKNPLYVLNKYNTINVRRSLSSRPRSFNSVKETRHSLCRPLVLEPSKMKTVLWCDEEENLLKIDTSVVSLDIWHQCYLRWIPLAHVIGGGMPVLFLNNIKLADEIETVQKRLNSIVSRKKHPRPPSLHRRAASDDYIITADVIGPSREHDGSHVITSAFPFSPVAPLDWHSFQFVPTASCLQISYTSDDDLDD